MNSKSMAGWIGFAAIVLLIVGAIDFFQGLIAVFEDEYFVPTGSGFLVFDLTGWGWTMMIWGVLLVLAGLGLGAGQGWARWFAIVVVSLNFIAQLGFLGEHAEHPLVIDGDSPEHHRALRAHCALEREPGRGHHRKLDGSSWIEAVARRCARRPLRACGLVRCSRATLRSTIVRRPTLDGGPHDRGGFRAPLPFCGVRRQPSKRFVIGVRRSRPKAFGRSFTPGGA